MRGRDAFQEVNITGVNMRITKHNYFVTDVAELADTVREAFCLASSGRLKNKTKAQGMRDQTFMNILRKRLFEAFPEDKFTYGNITKVDREALGLSKTHANDAIAISLAGCNVSEIRDTETVYWQQQRKKKRSLHEANPRKGRGKPNTEAKRNDKNTKSVTAKGITYCLLDKVCLDGRIGWITGFTGNAAYVKDKTDEYIVSSPKYKQVPLSQIKVLGHNNNWLLEPKAHLGKE